MLLAQRIEIIHNNMINTLFDLHFIFDILHHPIINWPWTLLKQGETTIT